MRYIHTGVKAYRSGITVPDVSDPAEKVDCLWAKECYFYVHVDSGTVDFIEVEALFWDSLAGVFAKGARRAAPLLPGAFVVDVKGHDAVALKVIALNGTNPDIKINYDLVQEA
ncbi:hypothetical protein LCGC14_0555080 [marine sediment metagenome]|uniref:Uncharacterized protein n=1 Tax=marine sediment metagenome TaxID=412755 RepID=A0A0F9S7C5_9ZZZZ